MICAGGFDPRRGGRNMGKMFGVGTYFAHNSSKADIYSQPEQEPALTYTDGLQCVFLARVCLGEPFYATRKSVTPAAMSALMMPPDRADQAVPCDSVVGEVQGGQPPGEEGYVMFREYVIYHTNQAIPEYLIYYKHKDSCRCSKCVE